MEEKDLTPTESELLVKLKERLISLGYNRSQVDSKVVWGVLSVVANDDSYLEIDRAISTLRALNKRIADAECNLSGLKIQEESLKKRLQNFNEEVEKFDTRILNTLKARYEVDIDYVKKFLSALESCETPEGRDSMRLAQAYINAVEVDTKYDNTAFIVGLSAILVNSKWPISEIKKINKKLPEVDFSKIADEPCWSLVSEVRKLKRRRSDA